MKYQFEHLGLNAAAAARAAGIELKDLRNWQDRHNLIPSKRTGSGYPVEYDLRHIMVLAAAGGLIKSGFHVRSACDALRPYTLYGAFLEGRNFILTYRAPLEGEAYEDGETPGRWIGADGPDIPIAIDIRVAVLHDRICPLLADELRAAGWPTPEELEASISDYTSRLATLRRRQRGEA